MSKEGGSSWAALITVLKTRLRSARRTSHRMKYPFEWFSVPARRVLNLTQDEAERMQQPAIGTSHLLLGLLREADGLASKILAGFGLEIDAAREMLSREPLEGSPTGRHQAVPTSGTKRVIENAFEEKQRTGRSYVGTEHLLVGILLEANGNGALVLARSGVNLERTRKRVAEFLAQGISDSSRFLGYADLALENLSVTAESALIASAREAAELGAQSFGSEYVLLGILGQTGSLGARVLTELGITSETVRARLTRAPASEAGAAAPMTDGLRIELRKTFLAPQTGVAVDTSALVQAVRAGGGLGGAILGSRTSRQQLDRVIASLRTPELSEEPIGRFTKPLLSLWNERAVSRIWAARYADARADYSLLRPNATTPFERAAYANNLAWVNLLMGDRSLFAESLVLAEEAVAGASDKRAFQSTLALALIEDGRTREGVEILEAHGGDDEDRRGVAEVTAILAIGKWREGDRDRARTLLEQATELDPQCALLPRVKAELEPPPS
ncbi:MAG TPA: Clp protease N-terminal domain-containing protein [Candidatus Dormibacteraeota bacterium]|nr:Clp protease N-terminal domain-containing protein [Candidatus Dormibacteraeota bacterium]